MNYSDLPKKRMGARCLLFNSKKEILLVKPNYKGTWEIPGSIVENNESPKECCFREVTEELGLQLTQLKLLVIDYNQYPEIENNQLATKLTNPLLKRVKLALQSKKNSSAVYSDTYLFCYN